MGRLKEDERIELCRLYSTGKYTAVELAKIFPISDRSICELLRRRGYPSNRLNVDKISELIKLHSTGKYNCVDLGKIFNISDTSVRRHITKNGGKPKTASHAHRKYSIEEDYFDVINSEDKAYFLGLLFADGYNDSDKNAISLFLKEEDKSILLKFNQCIGSNRPLSYRVYDNSNHSNQYGLHISNKHMSNKLVELGCTKAKSTTIIYPDYLPSNLINHFIRGYFDGDGCISITKSIVLNLVGNRAIIEKIQEVIIANTGISKTKLAINKRGNQNIVTMQYTGSRQIKLIRNWMYGNASIYLDRKFKKLQSL